MEAYSKCCTCIGGYRDGSAVQINDFFDNRETQSVSLRGMGRVCLIELVKNMLLGFGTYAGTVVLNGEYYSVLIPEQPNHDYPANRVELYGVVDQIRPYMYQQRAVARILDLVQLNVKVDVLLRPFLLQRHDGLPHLLVKPVADALRADALRAYLGQEQDIPDERGEAAGIEEYLFNIIVLLLLRLLMILSGLLLLAMAAIILLNRKFYFHSAKNAE